MKGMGTQVQIENYLAGHCSMRDLSRESNGASWPPFFGENNLPNGQGCHGFVPTNVADSHPRYHKDALKQTMLEHEAIFKNQVYELHRLYQVQRDLMDEVRKKEQLERQIAYEASSSSSPVPSQLKYENVQRWSGSSHPLGNSFCGRSTSGRETFQNCYSPKNSQVSDSRPAKLRRRILDLQLPADEYLDADEVEQLCHAKVSDNISLSPEKNGTENWKLLLNRAGKTEFRGEVLRSKGLADLNEPLHAEETVSIYSAGFLNRSNSSTDGKYRDISTNYSSSLKNFTKSNMHVSSSGISKNSCFENRPRAQGLSGYALESEQQKGSLNYKNQGIHLEKKAARFLPVTVLLDQAGQPPVFSKGDHFSGDSWKEKSDKNYFMSHYNVNERMIGSRLPNQPTFFRPPDLGRFSDQCGLPWGKPSQKSMSAQTVPFLAPVNLSKSPHTYSAQSNGLFNLNCSPGANGTFNGEPYIKSRYHQESAATCGKKIPAHMLAVGFDSSGKNVFQATTSIDVKRVKDMNLNVALPNDEVPAWLRGNSSCSNKPDTSNGPSTIPNRSTKEETGTSGRKLVFDMNLPCELSDSELDEKEEAGIIEKKTKDEFAIVRNHFDLNSCITDEEIPGISITTPLPDKGTNMKGDTGIDLEALILLEDQQEAILPIQDFPTKEAEKLLELSPKTATSDEVEVEFARTAAEVIIAISSLANIAQPEVEVICVDNDHRPLHWLADIACDGLPELDEFESMTLRLKECSFEEYFPKPSIPQFPNVEQGNKHVLTRKGPGRRGRQKRDFQKDILPGLTSLLRHEVSEDMQTFGGLMRATGYSSWQCAPNRKKGGRRGRPRGVVPAPVHTRTEPIIIKQQISSDNNREAGLTVTGWGKTTRRPRRQRLPPSLPLS